MAAILMTSLLGPDAELRWANWFKLLHMTQSLFWYRSPKIVTKFTRDAHSTDYKRQQGWFGSRNVMIIPFIAVMNNDRKTNTGHNTMSGVTGHTRLFQCSSHLFQV